MNQFSEVKKMTARLATTAAITAATAATLLLAGCAGMGQQSMGSGPVIYGLGANNTLLTFQADRPHKIWNKNTINGLAVGEQIVGIDVRPANGKLYAVTTANRLLVIDAAADSVQATQVGNTFAVALRGSEFGVDFNPAVDRIRVVSNTGQNLRLHPDTGAVVDADANTEGVQTDGTLTYAATDSMAGRTASVVGAAYTNGAGTKATTNYALDANAGALITQGTREGAEKPVSPNTGQLFTVGALGVTLQGVVGFDIPTDQRVGYVSVANPYGAEATLYSVDLDSGRATKLGTVPAALRGIAIKPTVVTK